MRWAYGITTVPERRGLLPTTVCSLRQAGFDRPLLFQDENPRLGTVGNWVRAMWTLYLLDPHADRYAIFQDDVIFCRGLREYLDATPWVPQTYLNLYSADYNEAIVAKTPPGRFVNSYVLNSGGKEDGRPVGFATDKWDSGKGALALVFDNDAVMTLLRSDVLVRKPKAEDGHKKLDGMVVNAMNQAGYRELIHSPSLCQHVGTVSAMGNCPRPPAQSFPGEDCDARAWLK